MKTITMATAERIWRAYREIQVGLKLLADVEETVAEGGDATPIDPHNRHRRGYSLGLPSGSGERILGVAPQLAASVIMAHVDQARIDVEVATKLAIAEAIGDIPAIPRAIGFDVETVRNALAAMCEYCGVSVPVDGDAVSFFTRQLFEGGHEIVAIIDNDA